MAVMRVIRNGWHNMAGEDLLPGRMWEAMEECICTELFDGSKARLKAAA